MKPVNRSVPCYFLFIFLFISENTNLSQTYLNVCSTFIVKGSVIFNHNIYINMLWVCNFIAIGSFPIHSTMHRFNW